jgi:predicted nucleic acid-binding protein
MNLFIDTNIFIRVIDATNTRQHQEAVKFLDQSNKKGWNLYTSDLILSEVAWLLKSYHQLDKGEILEVLENIVGIPNLKMLNSIDTQVAMRLYKEHNIKFVDCQLASICLTSKKKEIIVVTYDQEFKKIPHLISKEPKQLL